MWFDAELDNFAKAVLSIANGDHIAGLSLLETIRSEELRWWLCEHGQMSGLHRMRRLAIPQPQYAGEVDRPLSRPIERWVFERDTYYCRYCGTRVVAKTVLAALENVVGQSVFSSSTNTNSKDHGIVLVFKAVADHVVPRRLGGRTDLDNLVTACQACNYGKFNYTIDQLGLSDPRERAPRSNTWDGLTSLLPKLRAVASSDPRPSTMT
jgi:5-methylcytosine-specific restriction endonuclease McrA